MNAWRECSGLCAARIAQNAAMRYFVLYGLCKAATLFRIC
jgi:hypothetical protein